jgi:hypothetical protein
MLSKTKQMHEKYNSWCNEIKNMLSCNNLRKKYELNDLKNALKIANENSYTKNCDATTTFEQHEFLSNNRLISNSNKQKF